MVQTKEAISKFDWRSNLKRDYVSAENLWDYEILETTNVFIATPSLERLAKQGWKRVAKAGLPGNPIWLFSSHKITFKFLGNVLISLSNSAVSPWWARPSLTVKKLSLKTSHNWMEPHKVLIDSLRMSWHFWPHLPKPQNKLATLINMYLDAKNQLYTSNSFWDIEVQKSCSLIGWEHFCI